MARWGRTTDIEYVYRRSMKSGTAIVQGPDHVDMEFKGAHDGDHPIADAGHRQQHDRWREGFDRFNFVLRRSLVDLSRSSREQIMDRNPMTYEVMVKELEREGKLRPFGVADGEKISDPRNYLFVTMPRSLRTPP